jgi:hypothetical protein
MARSSLERRTHRPPPGIGRWRPSNAAESQVLVESAQERFADTVSARAVAIARLVHCFEHRPDDFDRYLEMAGFVVALD